MFCPLSVKLQRAKLKCCKCRRSSIASANTVAPAAPKGEPASDSDSKQHSGGGAGGSESTTRVMSFSVPFRSFFGSFSPWSNAFLAAMVPVAAAAVFDKDSELPLDDFGDPLFDALEELLCLGDDDDEGDDDDDDEGEAGAPLAPPPRVEVSSSSSMSTGSISGHPERSLPSE